MVTYRFICSLMQLATYMIDFAFLQSQEHHYIPQVRNMLYKVFIFVYLLSNSTVVFVETRKIPNHADSSQHLRGLMHLSISTMPMDGPRRWVMSGVFLNGKFAKRRKQQRTEQKLPVKKNGSTNGRRWSICSI